jgi:hypothetical protein
MFAEGRGLATVPAARQQSQASYHMKHMLWPSRR